MPLKLPRGFPAYKAVRKLFHLRLHDLYKSEHHDAYGQSCAGVVLIVYNIDNSVLKRQNGRSRRDSGLYNRPWDATTSQLDSRRFATACA